MWAWYSHREEATCTLVEAALGKIGPSANTYSIIRATANARSELMRLATDNLSSSQLEDLGWTLDNYTGCLIESAAMATYGKLQSIQGVELKRRHFPGRCRSMYDPRRLDLEMADFLWDCGFRELDMPDKNGLASLLRHAPEKEILHWFLDHGASNSTYLELNHMTFLHAVSNKWGCRLVECLYYHHYTADIDSTSDTYDAYNIGISLQGFPEIFQHPTAIPLLLSRDHCDCSCSGGVGCSPITSFAKSARSCHKKLQLWHKQDWLRQCNTGCSRCANRDILLLCKRYGPRMDYAGCTGFSDLCRVELFERLGMRHTCCYFGGCYEDSRGYEYSFYLGPHGYYCFEPFEAAEFREEDRFFRHKLEALMALYEELSAQYDDGGRVYDEDWEKVPFKAFWDTWWKVVQEYLPDKDSSGDSSEDSSELLWDRDETPVEASVKLANDEMVGEIRRHVQRSMELDGF